MTTLRLPRLDSAFITSLRRQWFTYPLVGAAAFLGLWALWIGTAQTVTIEVDGRSELVRTHRRTVEDVLLDLGFRPGPDDRVQPALDSSLARVDSIYLSRAVPYRISIDGTVIEARSWGGTIAEVLADAELSVNPYDTVTVNDAPAQLGDAAPALRTSATPQTYRRAEWDGYRVDPNRIRIRRASVLLVDDGTLPFEIHTTAQTVGEALRGEEITLYLGDVVAPSLGSEVTPGMRVTIQRSRPVSFEVDGRTVKTRTRAQTVADALAEAHIGLSSLDEVTPGMDAEIREGERIAVVRVQEDVEVEEEIAPYATVYVPDANLPIDTQQLITPGAEGITRTRYRVRYEDGQEASRVEEDTWIAQEPADRSIAYGQLIEPKTFTAADGTQFTYWRKVQMLASSYSAGTAGVSPDKPYYGKTYTGETMRYGIVAVDPTVIPLRSTVFVTGYGEGDALDIGSAIRARRIDLGYDDDNLVLWNKWVDVYLLWPPPASHQITWVLPNWPKLPQ